MKLIDTHAHLHFPAYKEDADAVLVRIKEMDLGVITIGTSLTNSEAGITFAEAHKNIWASAGLHPEHLTSDFHDENEGEVPEREFDPERLIRIAKASSKVVAIGETGLDFHWIDEGLDRKKAMEKQIEVFQQHVEIAEQLDLPIIIHCRDAFEEMYALLKARRKPARGVMHSFTGTWEQAEAYLDVGLSIGINGIVTFERKKADMRPDLAQTIFNMPLHRLVIETDAPYLAPKPHRGTRNEPAYVEFVARRIAEIRGVSFEEIAEATTKNAIRLFGLA